MLTTRDREVYIASHLKNASSRKSFRTLKVPDRRLGVSASNKSTTILIRLHKWHVADGTPVVSCNTRRNLGSYAPRYPMVIPLVLKGLEV